MQSLANRDPVNVQGLESGSLGGFGMQDCQMELLKGSMPHYFISLTILFLSKSMPQEFFVV